MPSLLGALRAALCATLVVGAPRGVASSCSTEHMALLGRMERADSTVAALAEEMRTFRVEAEGRTSALETQVEELKQAMASGESERRRAQRMGGVEMAHIITIETTAAFCAPSTGRPRLADCQNPSFERCHHAVCVPILEGHRRLQDEACTPQTLQAHTAAVTAAWDLRGGLLLGGDEFLGAREATNAQHCRGELLRDRVTLPGEDEETKTKTKTKTDGRV